MICFPFTFFGQKKPRQMPGFYEFSFFSPDHLRTDIKHPALRLERRRRIRMSAVLRVVMLKGIIEFGVSIINLRENDKLAICCQEKSKRWANFLASRLCSSVMGSTRVDEIV
jgi:hypothetical protein